MNIDAIYQSLDGRDDDERADVRIDAFIADIGWVLDVVAADMLNETDVLLSMAKISPEAFFDIECAAADVRALRYVKRSQTPPEAKP